MLKNARLGVRVAVGLSVMLALVGCGGVGSAPINGVGSLARVAVSVSPQNMTVTTGTTQPFTATVSNTSETGVSWLVNTFPGGINPSDGSSPFGTIDKNGNYTAPPYIPAPPTVTVTAVANADNTATANASVSINGTPSPVSISPLSASLEVGGIALFTATVRNPDPSVIWSVENVPLGDAVVGTVSPVPGTLNQVNYVAPLTVPGGGQTAQVHVTAQSAVNPLEAASAVVTLSVVGSTVVAIISPPVPPTVPLGQSQPFQASVSGASDTTVSWEVDAMAGGNENVGTIATGPKDTAAYTAPAKLPNPTQVFVTAVSNAQPAAQASILVNIIPAQKVTITVTPDVCINTDTVPISTTVNFSAAVSGLQNQNVTWQVNQITGGNATVGTIAQVGTTTQNAVYTAPASIPNPATVVVAAVSVADSSAIATQPLTISTTAVTKVVISPLSANVYASGAGQDFTAAVEGMGDSDIAVTWNVNGEMGGDPSIGTIEQEPPNGCVTVTNYAPPATVPNPDQVSVTAVTEAGVTSPKAVVTILPPPVFTETLMPGHDDPQSVQVQPPNNKILYTVTQDKNGVVDITDPVSWTLTSTGQDCSVSGGSICGTITPTGIVNEQFTATYTAPIVIPPNNQVTVTVASVVDPGASDFNLVTIGAPTIAITGPASVQAGTGPYSYTAIITGANPKSLVWNLGCISDSNSNNQEDFCDSLHTAFGPGCIKDARGGEVCNEQAVTLPAVPPMVVYTPPHMVSTADYLQNVCTPNGDPHASIVPIVVSMDVTTCQGGVCQATACVTVTPP